ncbi:hypothetical protein GCM10022291_09370 [Postechiella marina]|uniref:N-sulphoglucosamine sulphohydrolase C-terminal domain-containing protein n=1 Tax=Postechiella marina TaxID=943941 RepID=A0ABP8C4I4_9FLAO
MRVFQKILALLLISASMVSCETKQEKKTEKKRPNILFIMSDDHAYQAISSYDKNLIETPNIDRLAKEGIQFNNASVTNSICAPSRATILTGKHSHINGKIDNLGNFDQKQTILPQLFQEAGYQTAMFGKLHFGNNPKGVDDFMILPGQGSYLNPQFVGKDIDTTITGYVTDIITDLTLNWLKTKRKKEKPFMLFYLHKAPHRPWWPRADKFAEFSKKTFPEPSNLFDDYATRGSGVRNSEMNLLNHMHYAYDSKIRPETLKEMGEVLPVVTGKTLKTFTKCYYDRANAEQMKKYDPILDSINTWFKTNWPKLNDTEKMKWKYQRYMQDYLGTISSVDDNIGRVLDYLDESKLTDNTVVIYTSDQGFYLGEHGWFDKRFAYNESFKTPLLIRWPNQIKPGTTEEEMVQNLDFAQTMLEAAGIAQPEDMQGESLIPLLKGQKDKWTRDAVYYQYYEPGAHNVPPHYAIITKQYKLIRYYGPEEYWELFDRLKDKQEMNNVYDNPEYAQIIKDLKIKLKDLRKAYKNTDDLDQQLFEKSTQTYLSKQ